MKLLLDTCTFLWIASRASVLSKSAQNAFLDVQAVIHGMTILTPDPEIQKYAVRVLW